jgi:hypothetical protein
LQCSHFACVGALSARGWGGLVVAFFVLPFLKTPCLLCGPFLVDLSYPPPHPPVLVGGGTSVLYFHHALERSIGSVTYAASVVSDGA